MATNIGPSGAQHPCRDLTEAGKTGDPHDGNRRQQHRLYIPKTLGESQSLDSSAL